MMFILGMMVGGLIAIIIYACVIVGSDKHINTKDDVKHGRWTSSQGLAEVGEVQCSNCKTVYYAEDLYNVGETDENGIGQALMPNYCPHCGAYMGEVEE